MSTSSSSSIDISAQCLCKAHTFTTSVSRSALPLLAGYCHCTSCRHVTGALYSADATWPGPADQVVNSTLSQYEFTANVTLRFCGTCSTPMFWHSHHAGRPEAIDVFTGPLLNHEGVDLIKVEQHIFVGDTVDGGATPWLRNVNADGTIPAMWAGRGHRSEKLDSVWPAPSTLSRAQDKAGPDVIPVRCHCKGVDLVLRRGDADFTAMKAAGDELPWFVDPETLKSVCGFDACDTCRPMFGVDVVHWTFALLQHLDFAGKSSSEFPADTTQLKRATSNADRDPRLGTLRLYESSPDVQRYFCSRCSATVFYAVDDRPELVDVAVGLLEAPEGVRAESLLYWDLGHRMGGFDDVKGGWRERFVSAVLENAEAWRVERGYPKTWRRIALERASS